MNINLDSPTKLRNGEGICFPATIMFKSAICMLAKNKDEHKFKREIAPTSLSFTENDILAPVHGMGII